ncbi:MAG: hypothetical protein JG781_217 [Peptococcaceae bacterium]|jgi:cyclic lactone autoinducer peptide|nr:hypothetical protein [Peptococcaceae bacterium]
MSYYPSTYLLVALVLGQILFISLGVLIMQYYGLLAGNIILFSASIILLNYFAAVLGVQPTSWSAFYQPEIPQELKR